MEKDRKKKLLALIASLMPEITDEVILAALREKNHELKGKDAYHLLHLIFQDRLDRFSN